MKYDPEKIGGERVMPNRQVISEMEVMGIFVNSGSGLLFHGTTNGTEYNLVVPNKVWLDDTGLIHVEVNRRNLKFRIPTEKIIPQPVYISPCPSPIY